MYERGGGGGGEGGGGEFLRTFSLGFFSLLPFISSSFRSLLWRRLAGRKGTTPNVSRDLSYRGKLQFLLEG